MYACWSALRNWRWDFMLRWVPTSPLCLYSPDVIHHENPKETEKIMPKRKQNRQQWHLVKQRNERLESDGWPHNFGSTLLLHNTPIAKCIDLTKWYKYRRHRLFATSTLMMGIENISETSVVSSRSMRLIPRKYIVEVLNIKQLITINYLLIY
jgi:hypothetical protein